MGTMACDRRIDSGSMSRSREGALMDVRDSVLVTGAYGLCGRRVVERLVADGHRVIATAHRKVKPSLPRAVDVRAVDLTKPDQVSAVLADVSPSAIVHLAAYLPPACYANRA